MNSIPATHNSLMPYLILENAALFAPFAEIVFDSTLLYLGFREDGTTIMHAEIRLGDQTIMYCQATEEFPAQTGGFFLYVANADDSYHKALEAGAKSIMPPADQSYGRSCGILDTSGNTWWITSLQNAQSAI